MPTEDCKMVYEGRVEVLEIRAARLTEAIIDLKNREADWGMCGQLGDAIKALDECLRLIK